MQNFNIHTHTTRCNHAIGSDEEYVLAAIKAGITTLGFSDHVPLPNDHYGRMHMNECSDYINSVFSLKEKYKDQIDIKVGFECEYFIEYEEHYRNLLTQVDYLILGQHRVPDNPDIDYCHHASDELVTLYADQVCAGIKSGLFTYLAHPEYFMLGRDEWNNTCFSAIEKICSCAAEYQLPLEINIKGMAKGPVDFIDGPSYPYPHKKALPLYEKYKNICIFGLDCHNPETFSTMKQQMENFKQETSHLNLNFVSSVPLVNPIKKNSQ